MFVRLIDGHVRCPGRILGALSMILFKNKTSHPRARDRLSRGRCRQSEEEGDTPLKNQKRTIGGMMSERTHKILSRPSKSFGTGNRPC